MTTLLAKTPSLVRATFAGFSPQKADADTSTGAAKMSNNRQNVTWVEVC
jgi:hypothetical protein